MYKTADSLLGRITPRSLPDVPDLILANNFTEFFQNKVINIIELLPPVITNNSYWQTPATCSYKLSLFLPPTTNDLIILIQSLLKTSPSDPLPTKTLCDISPYII